MNQNAEKRRRGPRGRGEGGGRPERRPRSRQAIEPLHPTLTPPDINSFAEWALDPSVLAAIEAMNIEVPTPIQRLAIQPALDGRDLIAKAETGTGKTLAFGAPLVSRIDPSRVSVLALVLCPTRELAEQVGKVLAALGAPRGIGVALIVGGEPAEPQVRALHAGAQIVVGTPGRLLDLVGQRFLSFPWTETVVLDEADVMFEIGFIDDIKKLLALLPDERQTMLFSATFPPELLSLAREQTKDPVEVATAAGIKTVDSIDQCWMEVADDDRPMALVRLIEQSAPEDVFLVFCDRRTSVDRLMRRLERIPFSIKSLHGGYDQAARFRVMNAFRTGEVKALIATDVASRGLDVLHVTHVINFGPPQDVTDYTHRIGRTGRAGRTGKAITFVTSETQRRWRAVLSGANWEIPQEEPPGRTMRGRPARDERRERYDGRDDRPARERGDGRGDGERGSRDDQRPRRRAHDEDRPSIRDATRDRERAGPREDERGARRADEPRERPDPREAFGTMLGDEPRRGNDEAPRERARVDGDDGPREERGGRGRRGGRGGRGRGREPRADESRPEREPRMAEPRREHEPRVAEPRREREPRAAEPQREREPRVAEPRREREPRAAEPRRERDERPPARKRRPERDERPRAPELAPRRDHGGSSFGAGL